MIKTFKASLLTSCIIAYSGFSAFAAGFTSGKNIYDFGIEYNGTFMDNEARKQNKMYENFIEINNDFGITENTSIGFDAFLGKTHIMSDDENEIESDKGKWEQSFQGRHRMNFKYNESVNFGLQNALGFFDNGDGSSHTRWELRGMVRHDTKSGFYKHSRLEISYRKRFSEDLVDRLRFDVKTRFRLAEKTVFLIQVRSYIELASSSWIEQKPGRSDYVSSYDFKNRPKVSFTDVTVGPEFTISSDSSIGTYLTFRAQGVTPAKMNRSKGFLIVYSKSFNL